MKNTNILGERAQTPRLTYLGTALIALAVAIPGGLAIGLISLMF